jgi:SAM-dependent methyltransferase
MGDDAGTWHYGLIARWWAEFNTPDPEELTAYRRVIEQFGEPVLDLACGAGRLLLPLLQAGVDVEGADISEDMLWWCRTLAERRGLSTRLRLHEQAMHELDIGSRFGTIYICDSFGIGGDRPSDLEGLRRVRRHLRPGGALVFNHWLPYEGKDERSWARWLSRGRADLPAAWPAAGDRRQTSDGDEIELVTRLAELDPFLQRHTLEMRARVWRRGELVGEEQYRLRENLYFVPELRLMLDVAGFADVRVEAGYAGRPATASDEMVLFIAR